ncbi:MAG: tetratricopeptide repeat protein [Candidatus Marinimicrobia bacterium]|nr:tetratricopeptide repeat protein [Candidatus Neomarinimicrobiota bacterium]
MNRTRQWPPSLRRPNRGWLTVPGLLWALALPAAGQAPGLLAVPGTTTAQPTTRAPAEPATPVAPSAEQPDFIPYEIPVEIPEAFRQRRADGTLPETEDVARVSPAMALMYEGMIDVQDGKHAEAIPKLEEAIESDPTLLGAWETIGWAHWAVGNQDQAKTYWERLRAIAPENHRVYRLLAQVASHEGDLTQAEELYRRSLFLDPDQYDTRYNYGRILLWNGRFGEALAELRALHRQDPDRLDVELQLARALSANEEFEESLEHWNNICEVVPDFPEYLMPRAQVLLLVGALREAQAEAEHILELEPDHQAALNLLVDIAMRARRPDEVAAAMRRVMRRADSREAKANIARRLAYFMTGEYKRDPNVFSLPQCLEVANEAYDLDPEDVNGHLFFAELLTLDKRYGQAEAHFLDILDKKNPHSQRAKRGLLDTYLGRMQLAEAENQLRKLLREFNPHDPYRHYLWAQIYFSRGRYYDALESLDRLELEGAHGAIFTLLYHGLSSSEWTAMPSIRQFRDHLSTLKRAGFKFLSPEQFKPYFDSLEIPERVPRRSVLNRAVRSLRAAWRDVEELDPPQLRDFTPDRVVAVTFDDGMRTSFRWATPVAEELRVPLTMFISVGHILSNDLRIATFPEIKAYRETGVWEIGSHLVNASYPKPIYPDGRKGHPLPNLLWFEDKDRQESLREYYQRVRYEFEFSRRLLIEGLNAGPDEISAVAYPMGDVGQSTESNIDLFNVPEMIFNEAETHYDRAFLQSRFGHSMKLDYPAAYQRWEPQRHHNGQDVLRHAFRNHPVFLARRTRAEMATMQGEMHLALDMLKVLKRDGYPEEDLAELSEYVVRRLARLTDVPQAVEDETDTRPVRLIEPHRPHLGVEGESRKANEMIEEWRVGLRAGLYLNPRLHLEGRLGYGAIKQVVTSNYWEEVEEEEVSTRRDVVTTTNEEGTTTTEETRVSFTTVETGTNIVVRESFKATEDYLGLNLHYIYRNGSILAGGVRQRTFGENLEGEDVLAYDIQYSWRPALAIDMSARYEHDMVPSAREVIEYDGVGLGGVWRARDWWNATGSGVYWSLDDDNSLLRLMVENFWRIAPRHDLWIGLHNSVVTTDLDSDLYWTPYWDQRHYFIVRLRRTAPNYFGMLRAHLGIQQRKGRPDEWQRYRERRARAELQGWYAGDPPSEDWNTLIGIAASVRRRWNNGFEVQAEASINALAEHTERTLSATLLYRF